MPEDSLEAEQAQRTARRQAQVDRQPDRDTQDANNMALPSYERSAAHERRPR
ncbi:hypothetical protein [Saccharopolyspora elongata]|uniref:hypothetical protein n=1 Tax=Saccharopolyspora elongata TaxID=2530387 RepID=UPI0014050D1D|nr:hypothetical protein [Saccharopolyspora elongata]